MSCVTSWIDLFSSFKLALHAKLKLIAAHWALLNSCMSFFGIYSPLSLCLFFLFLPFAVWTVCYSCLLPPVLGPGPRWRPGEEWWFFLQALLHVCWSAQDPAQRRGGCQIMHCLLSVVWPFYWLLTLSLTSPYLLYVWGGSGCLRASAVGLFINTGCIPAWSRMAWTWADSHKTLFPEKAWKTRTRPLFTSCPEPTQILAFFLPRLCSFSSFSLYSLLTSALLKG